MIKEIVKKLRNHRDHYYSGGLFGVGIYDDEFDALEELLRTEEPSNDEERKLKIEYLESVGHSRSINSNEDIDHIKPMLSMNKIKLDNLQSWIKSCDINIQQDELLYEEKIDGVSGSLVYENGKLMYGKTRGDGSTGKRIDISYNNCTIQHIPKVLSEPYPEYLEVRGEFYINKSLAKKYVGSPLRNRASGIIKSGESMEDISFVAYQIVVAEDNPYDIESKRILSIKYEHDILGYLKYKNFDIVNYVLLKDLAAVTDVYNNYLHIRDKLKYETDGIVLIVDNIDKQNNINNDKTIRNHYYHNVAIKPPSKTAKARPIRIEKNISRLGRAIPVIVVEPVVIDNVVIERATLNNIKYYYSLAPNGMKTDSIVTIKRANDVIPQCMDYEDIDPSSIPLYLNVETCDECGTKLREDGQHLICDNVDCQGRVIATIVHWVEKFNILNVGYAFIKTCYDNNIVRSIKDLYRKDLAIELSKLDGFVDGGSRISKIVEAIHGTKGCSDTDIMDGIGIPGIGRITLNNNRIYNIDTIIEDIENIDKKYAVYTYMKNWLSNKSNYDTLVELKSILKSKPIELIVTNGPTVCITGTLSVSRKELEAKLLSKGYTPVNTVSSNTNYLIIGRDSSNSSKLKKAMKISTIRLIVPDDDDGMDKILLRLSAHNVL